jgi:hypothetical protein
MKTKNLKPFDQDAWKKSIEDHNKNYSLTENLFEILGSMNNSSMININIDKDYIRVFHNGEPIDNNDMKRLMYVYTHNIKKNKKGTSEQGIGWRAVASSCSLNNIENYTHENLDQYSFMISKIKEDIFIEDDGEILKYNKDDIISFVHAKNFYVNIITEKDTNIYKKIYEKFSKNNYGVFFQIPNNKSFEIKLISLELKQLFNRFDGKLFLNGNDILKNRKFYYIDNKIKDTRYLEVKFSLYKHKKSHVMKMDVIENKSINNLTEKTYYLNIKTVNSKVNENLKLKSIQDWEFKGEINELKSVNYNFNVRMMSFNPDKHFKKSDFAEWYNFYTSDGKFVGDGILPYIDNICLRYNLDERRKGYIKREGVSKVELDKNGGNLIPEKDKDITENKFYSYTPSLYIHRRWGDSEEQKQKHTVSPVILSKENDKYIKYKPNQNYLCELIETREMCNNKYSIINKTAKKTESTCTDSSVRGYGQSFPYFLTFLITEYIWFRENEENIKTDNYIKKELKKLEIENKNAINAQKKAEIIAQDEENKRKEVEKIAENIKKEKQILEKEKNIQEMQKNKTKLLNKKLIDLVTECKKEEEELKKVVEENYIFKDDEKNVNDGHCYCLKDPTRPMWRKIGYTSQSKEYLLKQYASRFFPLNLEVINWSEYKKVKLAEKNIFEKLNTYRHNKSEWFYFRNIHDNEINKIVNKEFEKVLSFMNE